MRVPETFTPTRIFEGVLPLQEVFVYPNVFVNEGSHIELHEHEHPHLMILWPGDAQDFWRAALEQLVAAIDAGRDPAEAMVAARAALARKAPRYRVFAIETDGSRRELQLGEWGWCEIGAGVKHHIELEEGTVGRIACIFSFYGPEGGKRPDPTIAHRACIQVQERAA